MRWGGYLAGHRERLARDALGRLSAGHRERPARDALGRLSAGHRERPARDALGGSRGGAAPLPPYIPSLAIRSTRSSGSRGLVAWATKPAAMARSRTSWPV